MRDMATGRARGFGFVEMATDEGAQKAITELHESQLGGRTLTVNEARPKEPRGPGGGGGFGGNRGVAAAGSAATVAVVAAAVDAGSRAGNRRFTLNGHTRTTRKRKTRTERARAEKAEAEGRAPRRDQTAAQRDHAPEIPASILTLPESCRAHNQIRGLMISKTSPRKKKKNNEGREKTPGLCVYPAEAGLHICLVVSAFRRIISAFALVSCATALSVVCAAFSPRRKSLSENVVKTSIG